MLNSHCRSEAAAARVATTLIAALTALTMLTVPARAAAPPAPDAIVKNLLARDLVGDATREIAMLTVEYLPGGASLPHRHNAQVLVYVLEGSVRMQVQGAAPVTIGPGGTFYEGPNDIHTVSANASKTQPARFLVFMIKAKAAPGTVSVP